jgi:hypothetical protein
MKKYLPVIIITICFASLLVFLIVRNVNRGLVEIPDEHELSTEVPSQMIKICIKGEINIPGIYEIEKDSILMDLIDKAGGLTQDAGKDINLVLVLDKKYDYLHSI